MSAGFRWTSVRGASRVLSLVRPIRIRSGARSHARASYRTISLDQRTIITEEIDGGAELLTAELRFVGASWTLMEFLEAGRMGRILTYRPDLTLPYDEYLAVLEHAPVVEMQPDSDRYGFNEWSAVVTLRLLDGSDWSLWSQHGIANVLQSVYDVTPSIGATGARVDPGFEASNNLGGVLARNGKIYCSPFGDNVLRVIDVPNGGAMSELTIPLASVNIGGGWSGGVLATNGLIYFVPFSAYAVLILDPLTDTITFEDYGLDLTDANKWVGMVMARNGKLYAMPYGATEVLIINPAEATAELSSMGLTIPGTSGKWGGGVLAPDGTIYGIPYSGVDVLVIDPETDTADMLDFGLANMSDGGKWLSGVLGPDGNIYGMPAHAEDILIIRPDAGTAQRSTMGTTFADTAMSKWAGGAVGADGRIYAMPHTADDVLIIDAIAGVAFRSDLGFDDLSGTTKWWGAVSTDDGAIYGMPFTAEDVCRINVPGGGIPHSVLVSPHLNKL